MGIILDEQQKEAVYCNSDKILVAASAGCGKTLALTERLKHLLEIGTNPKEIFAITYTNAAAQEMRNRINNSENVFIGTIHSLANRILLLNGIDTNKYLQEEDFDELFELIKLNPIKIPKVSHLLVDEFQDICQNEYNFITDILKPENFFYIGDAAQSIFSFKGSNYQIFNSLCSNPDITLIELNNNYRNGIEIIDFAENFLENMDDIYIVQSKWANKNYGEVIKIRFSYDLILKYLQNKDYKDWFILTRTNAEIENITKFLASNNIPNTTFKKADLTLEELNKILTENMVKVLTVHSAKGLESKNVIVISFKLWNDEEKRIAYVAATRAEDKLIWMTALRKEKRSNHSMMNWG